MPPTSVIGDRCIKLLRTRPGTKPAAASATLPDDDDITSLSRT